jgi:hypothetical protein
MRSIRSAWRTHSSPALPFQYSVWVSGVKLGMDQSIGRDAAGARA